MGDLPAFSWILAVEMSIYIQCRFYKRPAELLYKNSVFMYIISIVLNY